MAADPASVEAARAAVAANDAAGFARAMADLGVALELSQLRWVCAKHDSAELIARRLAGMIYAALHGEAGFAFAVKYLATMLVVRTADRIVIGAQPGTVRDPFPEPGWPIARWSKTNPAKNAAIAAAWAADAASHRNVIVAPRVAIAEAGAPTADDAARGAALFAALVAEPADVATRAVYADWLIERGDVRGEMMRLAAAGMHEEVRRRADDAQAVILEPVEHVVQHADMSSGLLDGATISADDVARHGAVLFARHPVHWLRVVVQRPGQLARVAAKGLPLERLRRLIVERSTGGAPRALGIAALATTRVFANLRELRVFGAGDDLDEWQRLFAAPAPHLTLVRCTRLASPEIAEAVAALLAYRGFAIEAVADGFQATTGRP